MTARRPEVAVLGASGFAGSEVLRLLSAHRGVSVAHASSEKHAGRLARNVLPALRHLRALRQLRLKPLDEMPEVDVAIACLPAGQLPRRLDFVQRRAKAIINVAGDYRLSDPEELKRHYPGSVEHTPPARVQCRYALPEFMHDDSPSSGLYNLPGCMASAVEYGLLPAARAGLVDGRVIATVNTGSSGSGRDRGGHPAERSGNFRVRHVSGHRHEPEIRMALESYGGGCSEVVFVVHSIEQSRGIFASIFVPLASETDLPQVRHAYAEAYRNAPFVHLLSNGVQPKLKALLGSNHAEIGLHVRPRLCVTTVALDNLTKGAAGQALQVMNIVLGFDQTDGFAEGGGIWP